MRHLGGQTHHLRRAVDPHELGVPGRGHLAGGEGVGARPTVAVVDAGATVDLVVASLAQHPVAAVSAPQPGVAG